MKAKYLLKGIIKNVPGIEYLYAFNKRTGGSCSARYCYSVWLRHLIFAYRNGFNSVPKVLAELGPGDSLGVGLAALISGTEKYYALDIKRYSNNETNLNIFDKLVTLFKQKTQIPNISEFPRIRPLLDDYNFPEHIFNDRYLEEILNENRIADIRASIQTMDNSVQNDQNRFLEYIVPWNKSATIKEGTVDMIISQAVLQAIDDLDNTYKMMTKWLKPSGLQSHDIGFKSSGSADTWYGHWEYSDIEWKIVRGRKNFFINREPYSTHIKYIKENNFEIITEEKEYADTIIKRQNLSSRFKNISDDDLKIFSVFIQSRKITNKLI